MLGLKTDPHDQTANKGRTGRRSCAAGTIGLCDPAVAPLDLEIDMTDLELDQRLRDRTPAEYDELWDVFQPRGRVDATVGALFAARPANPSTWCERSCAATSRRFTAISSIRSTISPAS